MVTGAINQEARPHAQVREAAQGLFGRKAAAPVPESILSEMRGQPDRADASRPERLSH